MFILGKGTNLLVSDAGIQKTVISMTECPDSEFTQLRLTGENEIDAGAGVTLAKLASFARDHALTGLEFAAGIPGSVGGALVMNAGAYGGEMCQVVKTARLLMPDGQVREIPCEAMQFGYRTSFLKSADAVALGAVFTLQKGAPQVITEKMQDLAKRRMEKQPLEYPSAGSTFKRPEGYFAGKLIQDAGLSGFGVGGAQVSEKHCGFVINLGGATAEDVRSLMAQVTDRVREHSGVTLEPEVIWVD